LAVIPSIALIQSTVMIVTNNASTMAQMVKAVSARRRGDILLMRNAILPQPMGGRADNSIKMGSTKRICPRSTWSRYAVHPLISHAMTNTIDEAFAHFPGLYPMRPGFVGDV
jgi:hypothetical protein